MINVNLKSSYLEIINNAEFFIALDRKVRTNPVFKNSNNFFLKQYEIELEKYLQSTISDHITRQKTQNALSSSNLLGNFIMYSAGHIDGQDIVSFEESVRQMLLRVNSSSAILNDFELSGLTDEVKRLRDSLSFKQLSELDDYYIDQRISSLFQFISKVQENVIRTTKSLKEKNFDLNSNLNYGTTSGRYEALSHLFKTQVMPLYLFLERNSEFSQSIKEIIESLSAAGLLFDADQVVYATEQLIFLFKEVRDAKNEVQKNYLKAEKQYAFSLGVATLSQEIHDFILEDLDGNLKKKTIFGLKGDRINDVNWFFKADASAISPTARPFSKTRSIDSINDLFDAAVDMFDDLKNHQSDDKVNHITNDDSSDDNRQAISDQILLDFDQMSTYIAYIDYFKDVIVTKADNIDVLNLTFDFIGETKGSVDAGLFIECISGLVEMQKDFNFEILPSGGPVEIVCEHNKVINLKNIMVRKINE